MNDLLERNKKDDSMEENINSMINDLLKEDETDKISINNIRIAENDKIKAPIISIDSVPFSENTIKRLPILRKTMSSQVNRKSNLLTNFPITSNTLKKRHSLETQLSYNFKEFVPSPKSSNLIQGNSRFPNMQSNQINEMNPKTQNNQMNLLNKNNLFQTNLFANEMDNKNLTISSIPANTNVNSINSNGNM
jgi:hypothetical protein